MAIDRIQSGPLHWDPGQWPTELLIFLSYNCSQWELYPAKYLRIVTLLYFWWTVLQGGSFMGENDIIYETQWYTWKKKKKRQVNLRANWLVLRMSSSVCRTALGLCTAHQGRREGTETPARSWGTAQPMQGAREACAGEWCVLNVQTTNSALVCLIHCWYG